MQVTSHLGARNLLLNCAKARKSDRILLAFEDEKYGYYSRCARECVLREAKNLGLNVTTVDVGFHPETPQLSDALFTLFEQADVVICLARLGDQLRFAAMPKSTRIIVCYALCSEMFGSGLGTCNHAAFELLSNSVNDALKAADEIRISDARGTNLVGKINKVFEGGSDTSIQRFPQLVFSPICASGFSGLVALPGFLTGTGSQFYTPYTVQFEHQVWAKMERGRLVGFSGSDADVQAANQHYDFVSDRYNIDRNAVHSWHAGIHPGCMYPWQAASNFERWSGAAFGNPRLMHFHTCGDYAPGEISWNVIDPTVELNGMSLWENGVFHANRLENGQAILDMFSCAADAFQHPSQEIGLPIETMPIAYAV